MADELVFFPDYRTANPYQRLLYDHAGAWLHPRPGSVEDALAALRRKVPGERVVFHLHWEDAAYRNEPDEPAAWAAAQAFLDGLETFADAGGRVLWTLHNAAPHDGRCAAVHGALVDRLPALADLVHVHSRAGAAWAVGRLGIAPERVAVVPHGSYLPLHRALAVPPAAARRRLGLPEDGRALLLFGRLGGYKGGAELLRAFAAADAPDLRLLVAGKQVEPLGETLAGLPPEVRARVHVVTDGFVPAEEVEPLFAAADGVALPYRAILTSGSALLALSLRRPVLAPAFPGLRELLEDGRDALLYAPDATDGLEAALQRFAALSDERLAAMQEAAHATAAAHDWRQSGLLLDGLLHRLVAARKPSRMVPRAPRPVSASVRTTTS
jgi:beta-1,4-mannosyltransferase